MAALHQAIVNAGATLVVLDLMMIGFLLEEATAAEFQAINTG